MQLADFIEANIEPILAEWVTFAGALLPGEKMDVLALRDHAEAILLACVRDIRSTQSGPQQVSKSEGRGGAGGAASDALDDASALHGVGRVDSGFDVDEVVSEYRALRATVLRLWRGSTTIQDLDQLDAITRFNEAMDQSLAKAVAGYTRRVEQSRHMFLAILGHDLRNPLNSISLSAQVASAQHSSDPELTGTFSQIEASVRAISRLVHDLLDFAMTGLGGQIPLTMGPVNLEYLGREVMAELKAANPGRTLHFDSRGPDLTCHCDGARMRQVLSNLLGNALQHGSDVGAVELVISAEDTEMRLEVRNQGPPIPESLLPTIFEPLVRRDLTDSQSERRTGSIGLGLFIARQIVTSHAGTVDVASSTELGTAFTARIPHNGGRAEHRGR